MSVNTPFSLDMYSLFSETSGNANSHVSHRAETIPTLRLNLHCDKTCGSTAGLLDTLMHGLVNVHATNESYYSNINLSLGKTALSRS